MIRDTINQKLMAYSSINFQSSPANFSNQLKHKRLLGTVNTYTQ